MQGALIVAQVAVSVVLLVGAGLLLASFYRLQRVETGYRTQGVLAAQVYGNFSRYPNITSLRNFYTPLVERLAAQPGVVSVAITNAVPLAGGAPGTVRFEIEGGDGVFGVRTDAALREFQRNVGLESDGTCGFTTYWALERLTRTVGEGDMNDRL